jgi:plasmid stability protein
MASLRLNVPEELLRELKERAERSHRPVEEEATATLMDAILTGCKPRLPVAELLARAKAIRDLAPNAWLTPEMIDAAINEGRP